MDKYTFCVLLKIQWKSLVRNSTKSYIMWITFHNLANMVETATKSYRYRTVGQRSTRPALTREIKVRFLSVLLIAKKGGNGMACKHERIKSVNCVIYCEICGEKLPVDYLVGKTRIAEQKAVKTPEKSETAVSAEEPEPATKKTTRRKKV